MRTFLPSRFEKTKPSYEGLQLHRLPSRERQVREWRARMPAGA